MMHRHINPANYTLAAIDDVISRGKRSDWEDLRSALIHSPQLANKIRQVCRPNLINPAAQRYYFWMHYVENRFA